MRRAVNKRKKRKTDHIILCINNGEAFIEQFQKCFEEDSVSTLESRCKQMQECLDRCRNIVIRGHKLISREKLYDWFFTCGSNTETVVDSNYKDHYDRFVELLIKDPAMNVKKCLNKIIIERIEKSMKMTSAQAAKAARKLNEEYNALLQKEKLSSTFLAASGEDADSLRPSYDYDETQAKLAAVEKRIRALKHALNVFNSTHTVPGFDMTVDEMLVYIPQLTARVNKLSEMKAKLPKMRVEERYGKTSNIIDYTYTNYDIDAVSADYEKAADELARAQLALDSFNTTQTFEVDF